MVRAPVSHSASRILPPITEGHVSAFLDVVHLRRWAQPQIPVKTLRHRQRLEWALAATRGKKNGDVLQLADATITDQLTSEAEIFVAALLTAGLQNAFGLARGLDEAFAFIDGERERFLAIHILAGAHGCRGHKCMP